MFLAAKLPASHTDFFPKNTQPLTPWGKENATLAFPACSPKADYDLEQFIITRAFEFVVVPSELSCLSCGRCDKNQMCLDLNISPSLLEGSVCVEKQPCQLAILLRTENYLKLLEDFQEWGLMCNRGLVASNWKRDQFIRWCLFSSIFLLAMHMLLYFLFYLKVLLHSES